MNNNTESFSLCARLKSMGHAIDGIATMVKSQHNAWVHLAAAVGVAIIGIVLQISRLEWCFITVALAMVWIAETFNTALECLCDAVSPQKHPLIKKSKDMAAGAVLISALGAVAIGLFVFLPYVFAFFR